jgi:putative Mg2+ transporter-C (MgtC) family protein
VTERPSFLPYLHQPQPATRCFPARYRPSTRVSPPGRLECRFPGYGLSASGARSIGALNCTPSKEKSLSELRVRKVCFPGIRGRLLAERHVAEVMDTFDIALRLSAASIVGAVLGLNRDLHGKPTGVRTLGVLCLGSALAVLSIHAVTGSDASRVIQGVVTGVGFLGAGVIVRSEKRHHVQGLTTAACVWVTACMGAACAIAQWQIVVIGVILILVILVFGGRFEKVVDRRWSARRTEVADLPPDTPV